MIWLELAACAGGPTQVFFPEGADLYQWQGGPPSQAVMTAVREAKRICDLCPVKVPCGDYAIAEGCTEGVWGGMDPHERHLRRLWRSGS